MGFGSRIRNRTRQLRTEVPFGSQKQKAKSEVNVDITFIPAGMLAGPKSLCALCLVGQKEWDNVMPRSGRIRHWVVSHGLLCVETFSADWHIAANVYLGFLFAVRTPGNSVTPALA